MRSLRWLVVALLLIVAAYVLVTPAKTGLTVPRGVVRIQYWEKWTGEEARQMQRIVNDFNSTVGKDKGIFVDYVSMSSIEQKTLVATAAGVPPDIAGLYDAQVYQFAAMDALEPLDDLARDFGITPDLYKPAYWDACTFRGNLWALISTPAAIVLHYNKEAMLDSADRLRSAGLDPGRPPATIDELDRYAEQLTTYEDADRRRIVRAGHLPLEPGWYVAFFPYWFGGDVFDESAQRLTLDTPANLSAFNWIASYSTKYGTESFDQFRAGLGNFASAQNGFLAGTVAMEQQGPWMANFIEKYAPAMNRWNVSSDKLQREKDYDRLTIGMTRQAVIALLGEPASSDTTSATWDAGIKLIHASFDAEGRLSDKSVSLLPARQRQAMTTWAAAPFPSSTSADKLVAFCTFDALVIPRGSKHKREAFEFIAYVNRPEVMEKLCSMHCKNSPLSRPSQTFIDFHPNPYIGVFESAAASPDAFTLPKVPIWPEIAEELNNVGQQSYLLVRPPALALKTAAERLEARWQHYTAVQKARTSHDSH